jgi:hypothetical protein
MIFTPTRLEDAYLLDVERPGDERGFLARTFCERESAEQGVPMRIVQSSTIHSPRRHTLRGLNYQGPPHREVKLVRCTRGSVFLMMVDLRPDSATRHEWLGAELSVRASASRTFPRDPRRASRRSRTTPRSSTKCRTNACWRPLAGSAGTTPPSALTGPAPRSGSHPNAIRPGPITMPELAVRTNTEQPGLLAGASRREPVSIICVFNDPEVRQRRLDRSIEEHRDEASLEYLPIDNVDGSFATAGAALNHGASLARHEHLAFVLRHHEVLASDRSTPLRVVNLERGARSRARAALSTCLVTVVRSPSPRTRCRS